MNKVIAAIALVAGLGMMAGTASAQTQAQCDAQARQYANANANPGEAAVGTGILGAIVGGVIGSFNADAGKGAAIGGAVGAGAGLVGNEQKWQQYYQYAFNNCMQSQPAAVAAPPPAASCEALVPPTGYQNGIAVGTPAWHNACNAKYNSFDSQTWLFYGFDGCYHYCRLP